MPVCMSAGDALPLVLEPVVVLAPTLQLATPLVVVLVEQEEDKAQQAELQSRRTHQWLSHLHFSGATARECWS